MRDQLLFLFRIVYVSTHSLGGECHMVVSESVYSIHIRSEVAICFCSFMSLIEQFRKCDRVKNLVIFIHQNHVLLPCCGAFTADFTNRSTFQADSTAAVRRASCRTPLFPCHCFIITLGTPTVVVWSHHVLIFDVVTFLVSCVVLHNAHHVDGLGLQMRGGLVSFYFFIYIITSPDGDTTRHRQIR
jgi:hypothetical protein